MTLPWRELVLGVAILISSSRTADAQRTRELGVQTIGTLSDPAALVAGGYGAWRTSGRTRVSLGFGLGAAGDEFAWRGEALGHFLLSPEEARKPGFYVAGGVAATGGGTSQGYLVLTAGLEQRPGGSSGWNVEAGIGGGFRLAAGYRWRW